MLTAWNGLMIHAFAAAGATFNEPKYCHAAMAATNFVLKNLRDSDGRLLRTCGIGQPAKLAGYLDDYAFFAQGLVSLYETTFDPRWLDEAVKTVETMIRHFRDPRGGFFYTADDHESLLARTKDMQDGSIPSGNATAALALLRLAHLTGRQDFREAAERTIQTHRRQLTEHPMASGQMLIALDFLIGPIDEIAIIGHRANPETERVLQTIRSRFHPNRVVAFHDPSDGPVPSTIPLLADRPMIDGRTTIYICRDRVCSTPIVGADSLLAAFA